MSSLLGKCERSEVLTIQLIWTLLSCETLFIHNLSTMACEEAKVGLHLNFWILTQVLTEQ